MEEKTLKIDAARCLISLVKHWYIIVLTAVLAAVIMFAVKYRTPQTYYASATVYSAATGSYTESAQGIYVVQLYSEIVTSAKIAERAASLIGDSRINAVMIQQMISTNYTESSPVLRIGATSTDPSVVIPVANAVARAFVIEAQTITGGEGIQILDEANYVSLPSRGIKKKVALAFAVGFVLAAAVLVVLEIVSDRVYRVEDAELDGELEIIGIIPEKKKE